jgi:acetolactate synthase-1/2/3 large subunit
LANLFDLDYLRVDGSIDLSSSIGSALASPKGIIIEVIMSPEQKYFPRLATAKLSDGSLVSPPLEDLDPLIPIDDLEKYLGYKPTENSFQVRGIPYGG